MMTQRKGKAMTAKSAISVVSGASALPAHSPEKRRSQRAFLPAP